MQTARTKVRRVPQRGDPDPATVHAILDEGLVCHVAFVEEGEPFVIPTGYVRDGDRLLLHGSTASRLMRTLASGAPVCVAVTLLDGVVLARSAFHHSMNYRSVVLFGRARLAPEGTERALHRYMDLLVPGRWETARRPDAKELAGTMVVELPLDEAVAKVRRGPPGDEPEDMAHPAWSGIVPLRTVVGPPEQDPTQAPAAAPPEVVAWRPWARHGEGRAAPRP
jgi:uncharacterized protein